MIQFIIAAALLGVVVYTFLPPERRRAWGRQALLWGGLGFLLLLLVTGRLHWLFALLAGLYPLARRLLPLIRAWPLVRRWLGGQSAGADGDDNTLRGRLLTLHLGNGDIIDGEIHAPPWKGQRLSTLNLDALRELHQYCEARDPASAALLRAFLDRRHGQSWRPGGSAMANGAAMTREEACAILAVPPDADAATITAAHRRLMQRMHPDRGGSDYLASRINAAKRRLLGS
ncbi:molecular chaperone DnaJ [Aquisalimonas sp.]|uniref:molecular chaperone DnaJ n=1 Tax=Aquisalimonas sp. TaxID=1872621 RepID=UPI0025BF5382|nr:molecular chaperone DnaJ [Aquisalimonas sp.]